MKLKLRTMLTVVVVLLAMGSTVVMGQTFPGNPANPPSGAGSAETEVFTDVTAGILITGDTDRLDLGTDFAGTGIVTGVIPFEVHANVQEVTFYVLATALYKGDDPTSEYGIPVSGDGCDVDPEEGNATDGDNHLLWDPAAPMTANNTANDGTVIIGGGVNYGNGFLAVYSEQKEFESGQNNRFSQGVDVTVEWTNAEEELPVGMYSGFVKLVGIVI